MANYSGTIGIDTFTGTLNDDVFSFSNGELQSFDSVDGSNNGVTNRSRDELVFTNAVIVPDSSFSGVDQIEIIRLQGSGNTLVLNGSVAARADWHEVFGQYLLIMDEAGGNDTIDGSASSSAGALDIRAGAGNDTVLGGSGNDILEGWTGDDDISDGGGNDVVRGNDGNDIIHIGSGIDSIDGGAGNDLFYIDPANLTFQDTLDGSTGIDTLIFTAAAAAGSDVYASSIETVRLGNYVNSLDVKFSTRVEGGSLADTISAAGFLLNPAGESIVILGQGGDDDLTGGTGNDVLDGGSGTDTLHGGNGIDMLLGGDGNDILNGQDGNDTLDGGNGDDTLNGGSGNDMLIGTLGNDAMTGGGGDDIYQADGLGDAIFENAGEGTDLVEITTWSSLLPYVLAANVENLTYTGSGDFRGNGNPLANRITGGDGNDTLRGYDGDDMVRGQQGDDALYGGPGNDELRGNNGADTLNGGLGNDLLIGGFGADTLSGNDGTDTASYLNSTAGVTVSLLTGTATGGSANGDTLIEVENLSGSGFDDVLSGDNLANTLTGDAGDDRLRGNGSADFLSGGAGNDTLEGGSDRDNLLGEDGNDTLDGGSGEDFLYGGPGDDTYYVDETLDFIDEGIAFPSLPGGGNDTLISSADWYYESSFTIENLFIDEGAASIHTTLVAGGFDNVITGNSGDNNIYANWGNDTIRAGAGLDHIDLSSRPLGATGANLVMFEPGNGFDILWNFAPGIDQVDLKPFALPGFPALQGLGFNDGSGNSYFALGTTGADYLYFIGLELADLGAGDFIFS